MTKPLHFDAVCRDLDRRRDRVLGELRVDLAAKVRQIESMTGGRFAPYCGYRGPHEQAEAKARGDSNAGWGKSPHNFTPAPACDLVLDPRAVAVLPATSDPGYPNLWDVVSPEAVEAWAMLDEAAKAVGLVRVTLNHARRDFPHIEMPDWRTLVKG